MIQHGHPPPFLLWPGFRGSIRERVSLRDKGARARGVGRRWGCVQASERRPRRPDARLRQGFTSVYRQEQHGEVRATEFTDRC